MLFLADVPAGSNCSDCIFLAVGTSGGVLWLWRMKLPGRYTLHTDEPLETFELVSGLPGLQPPWRVSHEQGRHAVISSDVD